MKPGVVSTSLFSGFTTRVKAAVIQNEFRVHQQRVTKTQALESE
jgi:hypothetical protein